MITVPTIPAGSTHVEYCNSKLSIVATIDCLNDFVNLTKGVLRFGKYLAGSDRFESLMPEDKGEIPGQFAALVPTPVPVQRDQHRSMADLPPFQGSGATLPPAPRQKAAKQAAGPAPVAPKLPPGMSKPMGAVARVHAACEAFAAKHPGVSPRPTDLEGIEDINPSTAAVQTSAWRKAKGLPPPPRLSKDE